MNGLNHLSLIMDGNGRWASAQGLNRARGHIAGAHKAFEIIAHVRRMQNPYAKSFCIFS